GGGPQQNNRSSTTSSSGRGRANANANKKNGRGGSNDAGRGRGGSNAPTLNTRAPPPYKRESMVAKPQILIKGTPTILGAKQLSVEGQQDLLPSPSTQNNVPTLSHNHTNATMYNGALNVQTTPKILRSSSLIEPTSSSPQKSPITVLNKTSLVTPNLITSPTPLSPSPSPNNVQQKPKCDKLMNENMDMFIDQISKQLLTVADQNASDFTVIGIVGEQGVGKSLIMNQLAKRRQLDDPFAVQSMESICEVRNETVGLDVYIIPEERLILIDSQPLFSGSILCNQINNGQSSFPTKLSADVLSCENQVDLLSIQLGLLMFSSCHVLIVACDDDIHPHTAEICGDFKMLRFVHTMRMLQKGVPNGLTGENEHEHVPEIIFVYNKVRPEACTNQMIVRQLGNFLDAYMCNIDIRRNGSVHASMNCSGFVHQPNFVNFFMLPDYSYNSEMFEMLSLEFRNAVLGMPRNSFAKTVSERDWLQGVARIWDLIKKSPFISEYNRSHKKLSLSKT
ncbi:SMG9, partial [Acrasis kona]